MPEIKIGDKTVGKGHPTFVIAEAGINHQGDVETAKELIDMAVEHGADAVKFQKRTLNRILTREGMEMPYDNRNSFGKTYGEHKKHLELSEEQYRELANYSREKGILFMASGWDEEAIDFLDQLEVPAFKMASADLTNHPLLEHTAKKGRPMILSTGMAEMEEVHSAYELVKKHNDQIALLQCSSTYPSEFDEINLRVINTYRETFPDCVIGYSGHEKGLQVSLAAVALGASIVERHFTLDRTMKGGDHAASLESAGLRRLIRDIRGIETALGDGVKHLLEREKPIRRKLAKSLVSAGAIPAQTILTREMLTTKGPGTGIPPTELAAVIGRKVARDLEDDVVIHWEDLVSDS